MGKGKASASPAQAAGIGDNSKSLLAGFVEDWHRLDRDDLFARGELLIKAHDTAEYGGDWEKVCEDEFGISHDTARNLMAVAKLAKRHENFRDLRVKSSTLYQLAGVGALGHAEPDHDSLPAIITALAEAAKAAGKTLGIKAARDVIHYTVLRKKHGDFPEATLDALDATDETDWPEAVKQLKEKKPETIEEVDALLIALRRAEVAALYKVEAALLPEWLDDDMLANMADKGEVPAKYRERLLKKLQATPEEDAPNYISDLIREFENEEEAAAGEEQDGAGDEDQDEPERTVMPLAPVRAAQRKEAENNDEPAETPQVPLDRNAICRAWREASEGERAEFARLFGDDVRRYGEEEDGDEEAEEEEDSDQEEADDEPRRGKKPKVISCEETLDDAISGAFEQLTELGSECREIVDNAPDGLRETERIQTLEGTADTLENFSEPPEIPDELSEIKIAYDLPKRRYDSRASRASDVCAILTACASVLEDIKESDPRHQQAVDLSTELESVASEVEGCEFPGMFR
jgi:hypothetical protein